MNDFLMTVNEALEQSRSTIKQYFRKGIEVDSKADASPVTVADRLTEAQIRKIINQRHPEHGILGEEHEIVHSDSEYQWVIDPIDGTKSFISGVPVFGTLIGLTHKLSCKLGVIDMPILKECWIGVQGKPTTYNSEICKVSDVQTLEQATLYCTEPEMFEPLQLQSFESLSKKVRLRRFGGDCYCYGLLASGQIDLVVEGSLHYFDVMALIPVIEGAGGIITDWRGEPLKKGWNGLVVAASTPELHRAALAILAKSTI